MTDKVENPFEDDKQDKVVAEEKGPELDVGGVIRRLAEIEDELSRRGIDPLAKEKDALRKALKDHMARYASDTEYDEVSNHEAVLVQRFSDAWDVMKFKSMLNAAQAGRYIIEEVAEGAVKDGVKNGDLSRGELESKGAVIKRPGAKALYVRKREEKNDGLRK